MKAQAILSEGGDCTPQTPLAEASRIMRDRNRQWLPLIGQEGKAVDVMTDRDICMAVANRCPPDMTISDVIAEALSCVAQRSVESVSGVNDGAKADDVLGDERQRRFSLSEAERNHIMMILYKTHGNKVCAAQLLGIDRRTLQRRLTKMQAPVDGEVLQVNIRVGQYAQTSVLPTPLILFGNIDRLHLRVDIDENDAWRFRAQAAAIAVVRGNPTLRTPLTYDWTEPYVVPKRSLTGSTTERVDTRVMQVVYSFERTKIPVFVGQQMDVFIQAASAVPPSTESPVSTPGTPP
jgi:HlyD family secretion protein